ncbi:MAG: type II secretion system protein [Pseudomonadota bacterium]|nr:type II secretion system protein [Pseudomonadota bacterium]MDP1903840.1 type II secretion system protein [Pseudomonadota bacterium]MDP2353662.1 type II secretion system protein [Pseudomonadota bacterium]
MPLGFTLVELVAIIMIAGILAAVAGPRFFNPSTFAARGYTDAASGLLRYAQKLAIARHAGVTVQINSSGLALCATTANPCADANPWPGPQGETPYQIDVPGGVSLAGSAASVSFDSQGRPNAEVSLTITGDTVRTLTVEAETGYVY